MMQRRFARVIALVPILGVLGCSDPVPASSAVGLNLNLSMKGSCPIMVGVPDDIGNPKPDSTTGDGRGKRVYDGEAGLSVSCTVKAVGNGAFTLQASISSANPRVSLNIQNGTIQGDGKGTAIVGLSATALPVPDVLSPPTSLCSLNVIMPIADYIKPGAVWLAFNCPTLESAPTTSCNASGEIVLENCKK